MNQLSLIPDIPNQLVWLKGEIAFSLSFDQNKILRDIMRLWLDGSPFDVDCTYSRGVFWKKLPQPRLKFDIDPQFPDVVRSSSNSLPLESESVKSLVFDPPFMPTQSKNNPGVIKSRFTAFNSVDEMFALYETSLDEFWRVLQPKGILVVKCQDFVSSGKNWFSHFQIEKHARNIGFEELDLFILGNKYPLISSTWKRQIHARKSHSYFIVFRRPTAK